MHYLEPNNFDIRNFWNPSSISVLRIKIFEIGDWTSEAIKTKILLNTAKKVFKWIIVYTYICIYIWEIYLH